MARQQRDLKRERTWRRHIEQQRASGLTIRMYCAAHQLHETSFYFWRQEIAKRDRESAARPTATPAFVPVAVIAPPADASPDSPIDIRLADVSLQIFPQVDFGERHFVARLVQHVEDRDMMDVGVQKPGDETLPSCWQSVALAALIGVCGKKLPLKSSGIHLCSRTTFCTSRFRGRLRAVNASQQLLGSPRKFDIEVEVQLVMPFFV